MVEGQTTGARAGVVTGLRRLVAAAMARDLEAFVLPGPDVARAYGLDISGAGLRLAATPRHAGVLLIVGALPEGLRDAASVIYAQMPRPRLILALGSADLNPLPSADVTADLTQTGLEDGLAELRRSISVGAFREDATDFSARALETRVEYTCPMHPEIVRDEPGNCPKCGMTLMPRETTASAGHAGHLASESVTAMPDQKTPAQPLSSHSEDEMTSADAAKYTCPMHPEVVSDAPGSCPKCGMHLVPEKPEGDGHDHSEHNHDQADADTLIYTCPMHPEVQSDEPGDCPKCGMHLEPVTDKGGAQVHAKHDYGHSRHSDHGDGEATQYTCPMHPEIVSDAPGSCPKCGMFLEPVKETGASQGTDHDHHDHGAHAGHAGHNAHAGHGDHGGVEAVDGVEPQFMSMVDITKDLPRSSDGLQMDWINVPFGPFFPGLPGGLQLDFTMDGDTVVRTNARSSVADPVLGPDPLTPAEFVARLQGLMPLTPVSYSHLAISALENAANVSPSEKVARGRAAALERERVSSHLSWLAAFGQQAGFGWLADRATVLQLEVQKASNEQMTKLTPAITTLLRRARRAPLLRMRLTGIARLDGSAQTAGPVARSMGRAEDARSTAPIYSTLGFSPLAQSGDDALARFNQRCDEIAQSLQLIGAAGAIVSPELGEFSVNSGEGDATNESPRGAARLWLRLDAGKVVEAKLDTPSTCHLSLLDDLCTQRELGDALVAVASLDISPWEIRL